MKVQSPGPVGKKIKRSLTKVWLRKESLLLDISYPVFNNSNKKLNARKYRPEEAKKISEPDSDMADIWNYVTGNLK